MELNISINGLNSALLMLDGKKTVIPAARMAVNEAVTTGRAAYDKGVRRYWNLKTNITKKQITIGRKASNATLTGIIRIQGRSIDLIKFGAKWKRGRITTTGTKSTFAKRSNRIGGVFVQIEKGKTTRLPHAFIARAGSHTGVFERAGKSRLPVRSKAVITMASMVEQDRISIPTMKQISDRMNTRFLHHMDRLLK
ncbi:MAG: hypothetical protein DRP47_11840 [Candidatus Zixiibacteriota bacterium]|nr:MAG: hypothetical protein DRP47_11840 [candidate division Zixibacteria bacterium]